jgi:hypothetical protein
MIPIDQGRGEGVSTLSFPNRFQIKKQILPQTEENTRVEAPPFI